MRDERKKSHTVAYSPKNRSIQSKDSPIYFLSLLTILLGMTLSRGLSKLETVGF